MPIKRQRLWTVEETRRRRGKPPLSAAHQALIEALAEKVVADLEQAQSEAQPPEKRPAKK